MQKIFFIVCLLWVFSLIGAEPHPLDPLTSKEIQAAVTLLREQHLLDEGSLLQTLVLKEPLCDQVLQEKKPITSLALLLLSSEIPDLVRTSKPLWI